MPSFPPDRARLSTTSGKPRIPHKTSSSSSFSRSSVLQLHALKRAPLASKPNHFSLNFRRARIRLEGWTSIWEVSVHANQSEEADWTAFERLEVRGPLDLDIVNLSGETGLAQTRRREV
jgi:hypothetical protein